MLRGGPRRGNGGPPSFGLARSTTCNTPPDMKVERLVVTQIDSVHTRRPVMVDRIANGADIEIPVLIAGAGPAGLSTGGGSRLGLPSR
jgi:hypothetical protein